MVSPFVLPIKWTRGRSRAERASLIITDGYVNQDKIRGFGEFGEGKVIFKTVDKGCHTKIKNTKETHSNQDLNTATRNN